VFMSRLFMNLATNIQHYSEWNAYLKDRKPKTLIVWGRNDPLIVPAAAEFLKQLVPTADCAISTAATLCLTSTPTRSPRRSSRRSPDRTDARCRLRRLPLEQELSRAGSSRSRPCRCTGQPQIHQGNVAYKPTIARSKASPPKNPGSGRSRDNDSST
jgi:hypothetical protein